MKIIFINISDIRGGSAIIAYNLAKKLEKDYRTNNILLVRTKYSQDSNVIQTRRNKFQDRVEWITNIFFNAIGLQYKVLPFSPRYILKVVNEFKPDVINLHNPIGGYFRINDLIKLSNIAPVVWTLHDMWAITGNASHTLGNENWKNLKAGPGEWKIFPWIGINLGSWLLKNKKLIYSKSRIRIITPSTWLYNIALESPALFGKKIDLVPHGIDLKLFKPIDKIKARIALNIPSNIKVIAYSAEKLKNNPFKGGKELIDIILRLEKSVNNKILFLEAGEGKIFDGNQLKNIEIKNLGYISDRDKLIQFYSAADLFIYPTKADSFGLVLLESIACGTPCISFEVGGCTDIIKNDVSGYLVPKFNTSLFVSRVIDLLKDEKKLEALSISSRKYAEENFSIEIMAQKYYKIFNSR